MIKLTNIYHEYINIEAKPNDQFQKKRIDSTKIQNLKSSKNSLKMHEFMHEIMKIKTKGRVERSYRPCERKNLAKIWLKTTKNLQWSLAKSERERKVLKSFEKVVWISQNTVLKKLDSWCSIDQKTGSIIRTRERLTKFFKKNFDWSKIKLDQSKFWKNCFLEKITWFLKTYLKALNIRNKNAWVWYEMLFQKHKF